MTNRFGGTVISRFVYTNDAMGRRTKRVDSGTVTNDFGYNVRSELIEALMGADRDSYRYDPIRLRRLAGFLRRENEGYGGQVVNRVVATNNAEAFSYAANALNQYTSIADGGTIVPAYDDDGNLLALRSLDEGGTTNDLWRHTWDAENRLVVATGGATSLTNVYDYMSRRIAKATASEARSFVYDGWNPIREVVLSGGGLSTNFYVWGPDLSGTLQGAGGVGGLVAAVRTGVPYFASYDANGNVTGYTDPYGAIVALYQYDPFGNTVSTGGTMAEFFSHCFSTKYWDPETDLYYYGHRFYRPELGRWLSRDPIGELGGENLYVFIFNEPISDYDEFGLQRGGGGRVRCRFAELPPRAMREDPTYMFAQRYTQAQVSRLRELLNGMECCRGSETELRTFRQEANRVIERFEGPSIRSANPTPETIRRELQEFCETQRQAADLLTRGSRLSTQCQARDSGRRPTRGQWDDLFESSRDKEGVPRCSYCGGEVTRTPGRSDSFNADHVWPYCQGGQTAPWNLTGSCRSCNASKGGRPIDQWVLPPSGQNVVCNVTSP